MEEPIVAKGDAKVQSEAPDWPVKRPAGTGGVQVIGGKGVHRASERKPNEVRPHEKELKGHHLAPGFLPSELVFL